jgi:hypothetical protein
MVEFPGSGFPANPRLNIKTEKAKLDPDFRFPSLSVARDKGGYEMSFTPARLEIDNSPYFDSVGLKCLRTFTRETTQRRLTQPRGRRQPPPAGKGPPCRTGHRSENSPCGASRVA